MLHPYCFLGKKGAIKGLDWNRLFYREIEIAIPILKFSPKGDLENFWKKQGSFLWTPSTFRAAESFSYLLIPKQTGRVRKRGLFRNQAGAWGCSTFSITFLQVHNSMRRGLRAGQTLDVSLPFSKLLHWWAPFPPHPGMQLHAQKVESVPQIPTSKPNKWCCSSCISLQVANGCPCIEEGALSATAQPAGASQSKINLKLQTTILRQITEPSTSEAVQEISVNLWLSPAYLEQHWRVAWPFL